MSEDLRISVITVCMNAAATIRRTLDSMLLQTYDGPVEYIIKDGGSDDGTLDIAESYVERFAARGFDYRIVSSPDRGIYDAMNQGIDLSHGDLIGIINADDMYEKRCLEMVAAKFKETGFDLCYGDIRMILPSRLPNSYFVSTRINPLPAAISVPRANRARV